MYFFTEFSIQHFHFTECANNKCKAIYTLKFEEITKDSQSFCPKCKILIQESHLVQCENCQTILNFIKKIPGEEAIIFYVKKCSSCTGALHDESKLSANYFPDSFI